MSLKTQKIIRFIPIVNIITIFLWIRVCAIESIRPFEFLKELIKIFLAMIAITAVRIACSFIFQNQILDEVVMWISIYFYFLSMAIGSVKAQEKILTRKQQ